MPMLRTRPRPLAVLTARSYVSRNPSMFFAASKPLDLSVQRPPFEQQSKEETAPPEQDEDGFEPAARVIERFDRAHRSIAAHDDGRKSQHRRAPSPERISENSVD